MPQAVSRQHGQRWIAYLLTSPLDSHVHSTEQRSARKAMHARLAKLKGLKAVPSSEPPPAAG